MYVCINSLHIETFRSHPKNQDIVAYGCRYGLVYIVNISGKGRVIHKIRAHDEDIQGLDWSLETPEVFKSSLEASEADDEENQSASSFLLAVSSRDKTVTIWNWKDASKLAELKLPSGPRGGTNKSGLYFISSYAAS